MTITEFFKSFFFIPENENSLKWAPLKEIRVGTSDSTWRCGKCSRLQPSNSSEYWLPDSCGIWGRTDSIEFTKRQLRENRFSGTFTAWCGKCVPKGYVLQETVTDIQAKRE